MGSASAGGFRDDKVKFQRTFPLDTSTRTHTHTHTHTRSACPMRRRWSLLIRPLLTLLLLILITYWLRRASLLTLDPDAAIHCARALSLSSVAQAMATLALACAFGAPACSQALCFLKASMARSCQRARQTISACIIGTRGLASYCLWKAKSQMQRCWRLPRCYAVAHTQCLTKTTFEKFSDL